MNGEAELITVFRSADDDAREDAEAIRDVLTAKGLNPVLLNDDAPGVPEGAWEVRVPPAESALAEQFIAEAPLPDAELTEVSEASDLDMETVFRAHAGTTAEMEAETVQSILEGAGIQTVLVGDSVLPNLPFEVRVAKEHAEKARQLIAEAQASGPGAAEQGAAESGASPAEA
jgi:hypothetical protein